MKLRDLFYAQRCESKITYHLNYQIKCISFYVWFSMCVSINSYFFYCFRFRIKEVITEMYYGTIQIYIYVYNILHVLKLYFFYFTYEYFVTFKVFKLILPVNIFSIPLIKQKKYFWYEILIICSTLSQYVSAFDRFPIQWYFFSWICLFLFCLYVYMLRKYSRPGSNCTFLWDVVICISIFNSCREIRFLNQKENIKINSRK